MCIFFCVLFINRKTMETVTLTVTPLQARRIMEAGPEAQIHLKPSGKQAGGFLPVLAALAAPTAAGLIERGIRKMTGSGHVTITATPTQFHKIASQVGSGREVVANFRISKSKAHKKVYLGAGIMDRLAPYIMRGVEFLKPHAKKLLKKAGEKVVSELAPRVGRKAEELGEKAGRKISGLFGSGTRLAGRRDTCCHGSGIGLPGRRGGAMTTQKSMLKAAHAEAQKHNRRAKKNVQQMMDADEAQGHGFAMRHLL